MADRLDLNGSANCTALLMGLLTTLSVTTGALWAPSHAFASPDIDRKFSLDVIGVLRASDNVDGLFGDLVRDAIIEQLYGRYPGRFTVQDLRKADEIFQASKLPYFKVIEDRSILEKLSRQFRLESLIRTRVFKEGPRYRFVLEWLHAPRGDLMATESFSLQEPKEGVDAGLKDLQPQIQAGLERLIRKIPFYGQVTGREDGVLTVNLGSLNQIKKGDTLVLGTLEEARRHPVLGQVVDWRFNETGKALAETVDEGITFARLTEEVEGRQVSRYQKVMRVLPAAEPAIESPRTSEARFDRSPHRPDSVTTLDASLDAVESPQLGWVAISPRLGSYTREFSRVGDSTQFYRTGSAIAFGADASGELWMNRNLFLSGNVGYASSTAFSQSDETGQETLPVGGTVGFFNTSAQVGYRFLASPSFFGPSGWAKAGYRYDSYSLAANLSEKVGGLSTTGPVFSLGADLPVRSNLGLLVEADFGILMQAQDRSLELGNASNPMTLEFFLGAYYQPRPRMRVRGGLNFRMSTSDFDDGTSVSQRSFALAPTVAFYF